mmetsp:Transcript_5347/g.16359  ORF Transcript_5347/g.16359 Transcript_5347/m.16359 type:complete len:424 (-) Transcript_5347:1900-3171(-)
MWFDHVRNGLQTLKVQNDLSDLETFAEVDKGLTAIRIFYCVGILLQVHQISEVKTNEGQFRRRYTREMFAVVRVVTGRVEDGAHILQLLEVLRRDVLPESLETIDGSRHEATDNHHHTTVVVQLEQFIGHIDQLLGTSDTQLGRLALKYLGSNPFCTVVEPSDQTKNVRSHFFFVGLHPGTVQEFVLTQVLEELVKIHTSNLTCHIHRGIFPKIHCKLMKWFWFWIVRLRGELFICTTLHVTELEEHRATNALGFGIKVSHCFVLQKLKQSLDDQRGTHLAVDKVSWIGGDPLADHVQYTGTNTLGVLFAFDTSDLFLELACLTGRVVLRIMSAERFLVALDEHLQQTSRFQAHRTESQKKGGLELSSGKLVIGKPGHQLTKTTTCNLHGSVQLLKVQSILFLCPECRARSHHKGRIQFLLKD